jgi:nucleoid-associated protein YgaU
MSVVAAETRVKPRHEPSHYAVLPGDTLWDIAAKVLRTDDLHRIASYWPRIHRANRDLIGSDPNLLRPGQVLDLPPRDEA